ncbi:uncharacterized protein [Nicotiana tomentosiformis]|uniref:uncharacterized protein n=1 Tax=Nicotiana tomentosiformis TaxID=4098 RepID=UPI00388C7D95
MRTEEANRLKDEESERLKEKMKYLSLNSSKANLVESSSMFLVSSSTFVKDRFKEKQKKGQKKGHVKKQNYFNKLEGHIQKSKGPCYLCGKIGHKGFQCNQRQGQSSKKRGKAPFQANLTEGDDVIAVVVVEANMVANKTDCILDTGTSWHLCASKELFHDFEEAGDGECVYMGNSTTTGVMEAKYTKNPFKNITSRKTELLELVHSDLAVIANEHENELRRSKRCRLETSFGPDFITAFLTENIDLDNFGDELVSIYLIEEDPKTYNEAMKSIDASYKPISSKWIFKKKLRPDSTIEKYKTRLVIRGFNQKKDIDYFDTYSSVTKIATIRTLIALAAIHN